MRPTLRSLLAASVAILALWGCRNQSEHGATRKADDPIIVVVFDAGRPADPDSRSSGIRLAVWEDGTVLVASDSLHPDRDMRVGQLSPDGLNSALRDLDRAGFFTQPETFLIAPDSAYIRVTARSTTSTRTHALDTYYQTQIDWWPSVVAALDRLRPTEVRPVSDAATNGTFRGYILAEWWRTTWTR